MECEKAGGGASRAPAGEQIREWPRMISGPNNHDAARIASEPRASAGIPAEVLRDREPRQVRLRVGLLVLMAVFFLIVDTAMFARVRLDETFAGLVLGAIAAQVTLCAVFSALAPVPVFLRIAVGVIGAITVSMAILCMEGPGDGERFEISSAAFLQWIAVQIPLWVFRIHSGWHLRRSAENLPAFHRQDLQFGVRQLMAWTAVVAVILSVAKTAIPDDVFRNSHYAMGKREVVAIMILLTIFNSLAAWPMIWAAFVRSRMLVWCGVATACSALLCILEIWAFQSVLGVRSDWGIFVGLHLIQLVTVGGSLLLVRMNGIRLVQASEKSP